MQSRGVPGEQRLPDRRVFGRSVELATIRELLIEPDAGARALVVEGEPGVGKTALWSAGIAAARADGWTVLSARGSPGENGLSFAGLLDLIDPVPEDVLASLPEPQRSAVDAALLRRAPSAPVGPREVGAGTLNVLRSLCTLRPVLLAVDDLQWLDAATVDALWFALRRLTSAPIRLLATRRTIGGVGDIGGAGGIGDDGASAEALAAHDEIPLNAVQRLHVGPLDAAPIGSMLADRLALNLPTSTVAGIAARTAGNPFWALEIGAELARSRGTGSASANPEMPVPRSLSTLVTRRLNALESAAHEVLRTVALLDQPSIALARRALALTVRDVDAAIDRAVGAGVVAVTAGRLRAAHPLLGAAVVEVMPPLSRAAAHRRLAVLVEDPEQRARHILRAWDGEGDAKVSAALEAGSHAAGVRGAVRAAAELAERAADCTPAADVESRCRRLRIAAEQNLRAADYERARRNADLAWRSDAPGRRHALPVLVEATWWTQSPEAAERLVAPLVADPALDPHTRAVVLALAADVGDGLGTPRAVLANRSLELFDRVGADADGAALCTALIYLAFARLESAEGIAFDVLRRIEELQRDLPYVVSSNRAETVLACWYKDVDDLGRSRAALRASIGGVRDRGEDSMLPSLYGHLALTEIWSGQLSAAREALDVGVPLLPEGTTTPVALSAAEALLTLLNGDVATTRPVIEKWPAGGPVITNIKGLAALLDGDDEAAADLLGPAYAKARDSGVREPGRRGRLEGNLGQALMSLGRLDEARAVADELLEIGGEAGRPTLVGIGRRVEGLALAAAGDLDAAGVSLEAAVAAHRTSPFRVELGRSLLALGQIQRRRKARTEARRALDEALNCFETIGAVPFIDLVRAELGKGRRGGDGSGAAALTPTERQVADLVSAGQTNREVAARLFVSVRTVETHLASIYRKLAIRSRSELAARWTR
ncbi:AAA family ATPase [Actinospica sp.]|uniref:AAA family ATPase n=1 Tax=Actinospica sp. TaxID=1872142 RepID=UPI002B52AA4E|nr:AAA family ATPase [Actinospica sp.]HWG23848.1 AAA family ATPase [Actinospica sp.]